EGGEGGDRPLRAAHARAARCAACPRWRARAAHDALRGRGGGSQRSKSPGADFDRSRYEDCHRKRLLRLVRRKQRGGEVEIPEGEPEPEPVGDLTAALGE